MNRTLIGISLGVVATLALVGAAVAFGWLQIGSAADSAAMTAEEHAGQDMSMAPDEEMTAEEHAGHDMAGDEMASEQETTADEHAGHDMAAEPTAAGDDMPADAVMISPQRQQLIGVRTATVRHTDLDHTIRTVGHVEYDERRVAHIHTKVSGWIEELHVDFTGKLVEEGRPLLEIYSPELVSTQEEYLLALRARASLGDSRYGQVSQSARSLLEATRRRLLLWDITPEQIAELEERREPQTTLTLHSPLRGFVTHKNAYEGQFVGPKDELFTIADLREVWVTADVYESDLPYVREGQPATVTLSYLPGRTFRGRVDYVYPYLAGETRTATVRVVLPNPEWELKPDMYANVTLHADLGEGLLIPEDAIIDSGERQVAFKVLPGGHFLPVEVEIGGRFGDQLRVLSGLEEGDEIVSGAAFLVDSESKLRSALRGMGHQH